MVVVGTEIFTEFRTTCHGCVTNQFRCTRGEKSPTANNTAEAQTRRQHAAAHTHKITKKTFRSRPVFLVSASFTGDHPAIPPADRKPSAPS